MAGFFGNSILYLFDVSKIDIIIPRLAIKFHSSLIKCSVAETYSSNRTAKFDLLFSKSNHPMSCRINDVKYFTRMRVTWEIAVRLKQSTQMAPTNNNIKDSTSDATKNAIASFFNSAIFSSGDAFVLHLYQLK